MKTIATQTPQAEGETDGPATVGRLETEAEEDIGVDPDEDDYLFPL